MPRKLLILLIFGLFFILLISAKRFETQESKNNTKNSKMKIDSGLVVFMPYDSNTLDYSGRNNHGYGVNLRWADDRFGNPASTCNLKEKESMIRIPFSSDFDFSNTKELSVGFWTNTYQMTIEYISNTIECLSCFEFHIRPDGEKTKLSVKGSPGWFIFYSKKLNKTGWRQYFFTIDEKQITFYINAKQIETQAAYYMRWRITSIHDIIIKITGPGTGSIDNLRIYNKRLSNEEINYLYNRNE